MKIEHSIVNAITTADFHRLSQETIEATKKSIIDTLAALIAGRKGEGCETIVRLVKQWGGKKEATILSYGFKVPFPNASFVNGVLARALDLDEVHDMATLHTSASIIPGTLGVAEFMKGVSGKEFIVANALGIDLICRMTLAPTIGGTTSGMLGCTQCGTFATAAAVGKLLTLNKEQMLNALGIAYSQASGNGQCYLDGSLMIRVQQGLSAKAGAVSAILAHKGITGGENFLEGKFGYFNVYHGGKFDRNILLDGLGNHYEGINVSQKPLYGCCKFTHAFIDAAKAIASKHKIMPNQIYEVTAEVTSNAVFTVVCDPMDLKQNPRTTVDAQFSLPYTVAVALVKGKVTMQDFTKKAIKDNNVLKVAKKVQVLFKPVKGRDILPAPGIIELQTKDGKQFAERVDFIKGHPNNPNSLEDCIEKMKACMEYGKLRISQRNLQRVTDLLLNMENISDIRQIIILLNP